MKDNSKKNNLIEKGRRTEEAKDGEETEEENGD